MNAHESDVWFRSDASRIYGTLCQPSGSGRFLGRGPSSADPPEIDKEPAGNRYDGLFLQRLNPGK